MARPRNPLGDPVSESDGRVSWYPSGYVGVGDRKQRRIADPAARKECATRMRRELLALRTDEEGRPLDPGSRRIEEACDAWLAHVKRTATPGTYKAYRSRVNCWIYLIGANTCGEMSRSLYLAPLRAAVFGRPGEDDVEDKKPVAEATFKGLVGALSSFVRWGELCDEGWFAPGCLGPDSDRIAEVGKLRAQLSARRAKALVDLRAGELERAEGTPRGRPRRGADSRPTITVQRDGDRDGGITIDQVPSRAQIEALCDAIERREGTGSPWAKKEGRGAGGGRKPLCREEAWRISRAPLVYASGGFRECELLALHTSNIDRKTGLVLVPWQLDRHTRWEIGKRPPVAPPKYGRERTTQLFATNIPLVLQLCDYADAELDGWLFAPTARQCWWADAFGNLLRRGAELLESEYQQSLDAPNRVDRLPHRWDFPWHYLRHHYGSYALSPVGAGGYGLSLAWIAKCMGHASQSTTEHVYSHPIEGAGEHMTRATV